MTASLVPGFAGLAEAIERTLRRGGTFSLRTRHRGERARVHVMWFREIQHYELLDRSTPARRTERAQLILDLVTLRPTSGRPARSRAATLERAGEQNLEGPGHEPSRRPWVARIYYRASDGEVAAAEFGGLKENEAIALRDMHNATTTESREAARARGGTPGIRSLSDALGCQIWPARCPKVECVACGGNGTIQERESEALLAPKKGPPTTCGTCAGLGWMIEPPPELLHGARLAHWPSEAQHQREPIADENTP